MIAQARISRAFDHALELPLTQSSRYIILSDCHRGCGNTGDNFLKDEYLYLAALEYYKQNSFCYIELGDGDELWENRSIQKIKEMHPQSFAMMSELYGSGQMYAIYGNHDMIKKKRKYTEKNYQSYYCEHTFREHPLCPGITFYSGIILKDTEQKKDIYLTHGHQADLLNSVLWRLSRFLVRYVWKPLEAIGIPDPTSAAKNNRKKEKTERTLTEWAKQNHHILVTGHTHRPMVGSKESPYFNSGSCIHHGSITGIEIQNRCLTLVNWNTRARDDMSLYAAREVLGETISVDDC